MYSSQEARRAMREVGLIEGLSPKELRKRLEIANRLGDSGHGMLAFFLADMHLRGTAVDSGHANAVLYARMRLDMSERRAREYIRVGKRLRELPFVLQAFCNQEIGWSKVIELVRVVVPDHQETWIDLAKRVNVEVLKREVAKAPKDGPPRKPGDTRGLPQPRRRVTASVDELTARMIDRAREKLEAERGESVSDGDLLRIAADLILSTEEDGTIPGRTRVDASLFTIHLERVDADTLMVEDGDGVVPFDGEGPIEDQTSACLGCDGRHVDGKGRTVDAPTPPPLRKRVLERDRRRCRCCGHRRELHVHHIEFREDGGLTEDWNLLALCRRCHALIHAGLLVLEGRREEDVAFVNRYGEALQRTGSFVHPDALMRIQCRAPDGPPGVDAPSEEEPARPTPQPAEEAFAEVVGLDDVIARLDAAAKGSEARGKAFPHVLFTGPPGTGKTTLARGVAARLGARLVTAIGSKLGSPRDLEQVLASLRQGDVLLLDEVHAVPASVLEQLYHLLEQRPCPLTLVAATTCEDRLAPALVSRFGLHVGLGHQERSALSALIEAKTAGYGMRIDDDASALLAAHARGTPREALRLLDRVLDHVAIAQAERINTSVVSTVLDVEGFDNDGLSPDEQRYMAVVAPTGFVSLGQIARRMGKDEASVRDCIEPNLLRRNLIEITRRGRVATRLPAPLRLHENGGYPPSRNSSGSARFGGSNPAGG